MYATSVIRQTGIRGVASGRPIRYGDRIQVRLARVQYGGPTLAEFTLTNVSDFSEIYGELRYHTRGLRGLTRLYVRNATRGWMVQQPFMLYPDIHRKPAAGTNTRKYSATDTTCLPDSVRMLCEH